jgi:hypothetical protein
VIECVPPPSDEVLKIAAPAIRVLVPSGVLPSMKVTFPPEGVPPLEVTVALMVNEAPTVDGFSDESTVVEVVAWFTCWVIVVEVLVE